ncbi:MAG TPA: ABC transporter permease [Acidobacteriota bacterium]|nr:ABC transporter permease [Acidobacteriota bacterium]
MIKGLGQDFRYALGYFAKAPTFTVLAVLSLALGIGANTAIFSVVHAVLLRPLAYPQPDRLLRVWETFQHARGQGRGSVSVPNLLDWREQNSVFRQLAAYSQSTYALSGDDRPLLVRGARVEPEMKDVLQVEPLRGRFFEEGENQSGKDQVVLLSHGLWERRFGSDPAVIGQPMSLDGVPHEIIGVMPVGFELPPRSASELWTPLTYTEGQLNARGSHWLAVLGRLKPDVPQRQAESEMSAIAARLAEAYPDSQDRRGIVISTLHQSLTESRSEALWTLWAAVSIVLLIGCANVANLLLARAVGRRRELAVRAALGAGRARLVRQMLSETALLALAGGAAGLILSVVAVRVLSSLPGSSIPQGQVVGVNPVVLAFCLGASLLTAFLAGLFPALRASRFDVGDALRERSSSESAGSSRDWLRAGLVVAEVALAVVVLIGAGLLLKSYSRLLQVDPGLDAQRVLTMTVPLAGPGYDESEEILAFYRRLNQELPTIPGVEAAGMINLLPMQNWGWNSNIVIEGMPEVPPSQQPLSEVRTIAGDYFRAMGIPLLSGRTVPFDYAEDARPEVMVNKTFADRFLDGQDPVGKRIAFGYPESDEGWISIVGMVADVRSAGLDRQPLPEMYFSLGLSPRRNMGLALRTTLDPASLSESVRRKVAEIDPAQPVYRVKVMEEVVDDSVASRRFNTLLMGVFAAVALTLALGGVYGVLSYAVRRRTYELAVRMALGARRGDVYRLVITGSLVLAVIGILAGATASLWLTSFLESQLYSVQAGDPLTIVWVCAILLGVCLAASLLPARRATHVDPLTALRSE